MTAQLQAAPKPNNQPLALSAGFVQFGTLEHLAAIPVFRPRNRILFGIVDQHEVDAMMQEGMASGGVSLGYPPPASATVKWDPASRAPLNLTQPSNMGQILRRGETVRRVSRPMESAVSLAGMPAVMVSPTLLTQTATAQPFMPVASTSKIGVPPANSAPSTASAVEPSRPPVGGTIELGQLKEEAGPEPGSGNRRSPVAALRLRNDHTPLAIVRTGSTQSSPTSPRSVNQTPPKATASPSAGVVFSRALRPPPAAGPLVIADDRPMRIVRPGSKSQQLQLSGSATSPSDTPLASSEAATSTAPTSPLLLSSSPPTRTTSPRPALKAKLWADLLRSPNSTPIRKRVSIALPPSDDGTSSSGGPPTTIASPPQRFVAPPTLPAPPEAPSQSATQTSAVLPVAALPTPMAQYAPYSAPAKRKLEDILRGVEHRYRAPMIQPRGLVNTGNQCFENSILQVLLYCGPFYNLLRLLGQETTHDFSDRFTCLEAMIAFVEEFSIGKREDGNNSQFTAFASNGGPHKPSVADAFTPEGVYGALRGNKRFEVMMRGSQEDAQEFLGFLLDTLHEELLALIDVYDGTTERPIANGVSVHESQGEDGWLEVGSKGRTATTRSTEGRDSPITRIFAGKQRSTLRVPGHKDSATVEPFLTLQLDIAPEAIDSIEAAIANICTTDILSDYEAKPGFQIEALKQLSIEALPPVLVLHLKRFSYDANAETTIKNHKVIGFDTELAIEPAWLSPAARQAAPASYSLSAVVYHHGRNATGGHYTVALKKQDGQWINIDDTTITDISPADVAVDRTREVLRLSLPSAMDGVPERTAYLLFYTCTS